MYNCEKSYKALELYRVLELLSNEADIPAAKELAKNLKPFSDLESVLNELKKTDEAFILSAKYAMPSFGSPADPAPLLTRAEVGGLLSMSDLLSVADSLRVIRVVKEWRENISDNALFALNDLFSLLAPNKYLEDTINFAIKSPEEMNDNASVKLSDIRRKMRTASSKIKDKLDRIVKNYNTAKYLQETIVTQRDGRYVVPVKAEFKSEISGIVHDTSSTGATMFIEPMAVVEANNELRVLQLEEREEIERILWELSAKVSEFASSVKLSFTVLCEINLIFAKANLAYKMRASMPKVNIVGRTVLKNARHPLIDKNSVVPISVSLGKEYNTLVITGPNTGGKTVTLKTVGLLTLMAMCGLMIPADEGSELSFYEQILVDIGDEQSIEYSLSTFSSHMVNIVNIINSPLNSSLVLLDELGNGTDPLEGSALAKAILIHLSYMGAKTIATTHYPELKSYALETEGVENASCEFDVKTMKPTYRLLIGVPGKSNAFSISSKLGLPDGIVEAARSYISDEDKKLDKITEALETARISAEEELKKAEKMQKNAENALKNAELKLAEAENKCEKLLEKAKNDASYIIDNARYKSNNLLSELEDIKKKINAENASELYGSAKRNISMSIEDMENTADPIRKREEEGYILPRELVVGDNVVLADLNQKGTVEQISKDNKRVYVAIGSIKSWTDVSNIRLSTEKVIKQQNPKTRRVTGVKSKAERDVRYEFDMRGMTVDEGIMELDRYIDGAVLAGIPSVTIIHGKGTGALRAAVHNFLKSNKHIITYRLGVFGEGEAGVTIAEIKS